MTLNGEPFPARVEKQTDNVDERYGGAETVVYVDLCLKVRKMGLLVVYDAFCELYHYESVSRGLDEIDEKKRERQLEEARILRDKWPEIFRNGDPYFNPNLEYNAADYVLAGTMPEGYTPLQELSRKMKAGDRKR